jgi:thiamine-phosphate pyrophosphorylase
MRGLYAIVDPEHCGGREPRVVAERILQGGCALLQLRAKRVEDAVREALARELAQCCQRAGVPFVVNDDPQLATAVGAWGVHVGQNDASIESIRARHAELRVGVSTHDRDQAVEAWQRGADLIGFGPVFPTRTKQDPDPVVGIEGLRRVCDEIALPVVAIGGIDQAKVGSVVAVGAPLVAAVSAVGAAPDVTLAARALHDAVRTPVEDPG